MGLIAQALDVLFGSGRNVLRETAEVFRENAEAGAGRAQIRHAEALAQFAAEFDRDGRGAFDRAVDGLNRLPRPALALGTLGLFVAAMVDPVWFAARMQGIALVPEPLWWLMGAIVSFYFGARHQAKGQEFRRAMSASLARVEQVESNLRALDALASGARQGAQDGSAGAGSPGDNPALADWRRGQE